MQGCGHFLTPISARWVRWVIWAGHILSWLTLFALSCGRYGSVDPKPSFAFPDEEVEERAHRAAASRAPLRSPFQYYQQHASDSATSPVDEGQGDGEDEHDTLLGPAYGPRGGYEALGGRRAVSPARVAACGLMVGLLVVIGALLHLER